MAAASIAGFREAPHHLVGAVLGAGEDEGALECGFGRGDRRGARSLLAFSTWITCWSTCSTVVARRDLDARRLLEQSVGEAGDLLRHRRREEQVLALLRQQRGDAADGVDEAQIEHLVDFVEHEDLELAEAQRRAARSDRRGGPGSPPGYRRRCASARSCGEMLTPPNTTARLELEKPAIGAKARRRSARQAHGSG